MKTVKEIIINTFKDGLLMANNKLTESTINIYVDNHLYIHSDKINSLVLKQKLTEFKSLVSEMRNAQKAYFKDRNLNDLALAKKYERLIDKELVPNLFSNE